MALLQNLKVYFVGNFHSADFSYVLYPFLRVFKLFGFAPVKLRKGDILRHKCERLQWDVAACMWAFACALFYCIGFGMGVRNLSMPENWRRLHDSSRIAYFASMAQVLALFVLGAVALITSWTHTSHMRQLCTLIYQVDHRLSAINVIKIDYTCLRRSLFLEFMLEFLLVPGSMSMVNCIIIQQNGEIFVFMTWCFWFICFAPIMMITFKEFQFYNFMFILKSKFDHVNEQLKHFADKTYRKRRSRYVRKVHSASEIPLTAVALTPTASVDLVDAPNFETMQELLEIYSRIADGVELVLKIFSWHLLLMTTVSFGVITIQSYNLFALIVHSLQMEPYQIVFTIAWILVQIAAIGINVSACSMTNKTMLATGPLLHKLKVQASPENACIFYQILQLFSLEVLQRKNSFTAAGFFDIDYKLITSIITAVTTYLVIIIQFHLSNVTDVSQNATTPM